MTDAMISARVIRVDACQCLSFDATYNRRHSMREAYNRGAIFLITLLFVAPAAESLPQRGATGQSYGRANTWSATSSNGLVLSGTWTAVSDAATGNVSGTWTLIDAQGRTVMQGGWSAAKAQRGWTGSWRAVVSGRGAEYAGQWSAAVGIEPTAPLSRLFEKAAQAAVSGRWSSGRRSGAWSIRAAAGTR